MDKQRAIKIPMTEHEKMVKRARISASCDGTKWENDPIKAIDSAFTRKSNRYSMITILKKDDPLGMAHCQACKRYFTTTVDAQRHICPDEDEWRMRRERPIQTREQLVLSGVKLYEVDNKLKQAAKRNSLNNPVPATGEPTPEVEPNPDVMGPLTKTLPEQIVYVNQFDGAIFFDHVFKVESEIRDLREEKESWTGASQVFLDTLESQKTEISQLEANLLESYAANVALENELEERKKEFQEFIPSPKLDGRMGDFLADS